MDPADVAEHVRDAVESGDEKLRTQAAITIAVLAMLLAIASLGGDNAATETIHGNIQASDTWAFYQAKNVRQTANQIAAQELEAQLVLHGGSLDEASRQRLQQNIEGYRATVARYESEPDPADPTNPLKGEGKKELTARARHFEEQRDRALAQDPNFDYSTALLQIAIVLGSVSIVATSRPILVGTIVVGGLATVLLLNGFFLFFELPIG